MVIGGKPSAVTNRVSGDTNQLPMELEITTGWFSQLPALFFGAVCAVLGFGSFGMFPAAPQYGRLIELIYYFAPLAIGVVGLYYFGRSVFNLANKKVVRIENGQVTLTGKAFPGARSWTEPLAAYEGVRWRRFVIHRRANSSSNTDIRGPAVYQVLDLLHADPARCVPLGVTRFNNVTRSKWEHFATLFDLPAIDATDGEVRVRAAEDVDKSIKELAEEGKIDAQWDGRPPPTGLTLTHEGSEADPDAKVLVVTLLARKFPVWIYGALMAFGSFFLILGLKDLSFIAILIGGGLAAGVSWHWRYEGHNPRTVHIMRDKVEITTPSPGNPPVHKIIQHAAIEGVHIKTSSFDDMEAIGPQLVIVTDQEDFRIGSGLSKDGLAWLRDLILAAVVKA